MAADLARTTSYGDEEALGALLEVDRPTHNSAPPRQRTAARGFVAIAIVAGVFSLVGWFASVKQQRPVTGPAGSITTYESKVEALAVLEPQKALEKVANRQKLIVEEDLKAVLHHHTFRRGAHFKDGAGSAGGELCYKQAGVLFDDVAGESALVSELNKEEFDAFKTRFASAMKSKCRDIDSEMKWREQAAIELEGQKPIMTESLAASFNTAKLGFTTEMKEWMTHEAVADFQKHLGMLPTPEGQKSVLKRKVNRQASRAELPDVFRAEEKWPMCKEAILRIHNQGHCGSCWAFGGVASIDARMCIASNGTWNAAEDILSRLQVTSCAPNLHYPGHDGCQGGFPHWPMEYMAQRGVTSSSCLPYYIGGEGTEHFEHQDAAPPCMTHCQEGYSLTMSQDTFSSAGIENYDWLTEVHGDATKIASTKLAIYQEGPVAFAFFANQPFMGYSTGVFSVCTGTDQANHAVYAFGWGIAPDMHSGGQVEFLEASNSWGPNWGDNGHFKIHPLCITDVVIAGTIEQGVVGHTVGTVDDSVPPDSSNEYWPWEKPDECPYSDGCVTDMEGDGQYANNELCVSKALNGKKIRVVEFDMEYGYDILSISGHKFSGADGRGLDLDELNGMVVGAEGISFTSDGSVPAPGFKICEA